VSFKAAALAAANDLGASIAAVVAVMVAMPAMRNLERRSFIVLEINRDRSIVRFLAWFGLDSLDNTIEKRGLEFVLVVIIFQRLLQELLELKVVRKGLCLSLSQSSIAFASIRCSFLVKRKRSSAQFPRRSASDDLVSTKP
jgi:hypothetical protein